MQPVWNMLLLFLLSMIASHQLLTSYANRVVDRDPIGVGGNKDLVGPISSRQQSQEVDDWESWKKNRYFVPGFDPNVISVPVAQRDFDRQSLKEELVLIREITQEAINKRSTLFPSIHIGTKYGFKLINSLIKVRREQMKITPQLTIPGDYYRMVADLMEKVLRRSGEIKKEKGYNKHNVPADELYDRLDAIYQYVERIVESSPVAGYLKWNEVVLFKGLTELPRHDLDLVEETADITAQFRAMGYEGAMWVAKRLVALVRLFASGSVPDDQSNVSKSEDF